MAFVRELVDKLARPAHDIREERLQEMGSLDRGHGRQVNGRQRLSGIRLGSGFIFEGTTGEGWLKQLQVLHPDYQLLPGPEHG